MALHVGRRGALTKACMAAINRGGFSRCNRVIEQSREIDGQVLSALKHAVSDAERLPQINAVAGAGRETAPLGAGGSGRPATLVSVGARARQAASSKW